MCVWTRLTHIPRLRLFGRCLQLQGVLAVTLLMYALATIHCFAELSRLINGFINHKADPAVLTTYNTLNDVGRMLIYVLNNSLSDAVVVWRCIVVWQRDWVACAVPILLLLAMTSQYHLKSIVHSPSDICDFSQRYLRGLLVCNRTYSGPGIYCSVRSCHDARSS